jgi:hypothetical protein
MTITHLNFEGIKVTGDKMSLKIFYDPVISDDGSIIGVELVIKNKDKHLSIQDIQDNELYFFERANLCSVPRTFGDYGALDMTQQENLNKINNLIKKVLE